jgi:hypothetical protein
MKLFNNSEEEYYPIIYKYAFLHANNIEEGDKLNNTKIEFVRMNTFNTNKFQPTSPIVPICKLINPEEFL